MANFIKDSADNYTLFVNQGANYTLVIDADLYGISDLTNYQFFGTIKQHPTSLKSYDIDVVKNIGLNTITIRLSPDVTSELKYQKYSFDVIYKNTISNEITRAFGGSVIVKNNISSV